MKRILAAAVIMMLCVSGSFAQGPAEPAPAPTPAPTPPPTPAAPDATARPIGIASLFTELPTITGPGQFWATGDYLFAFVRGTNLPPLVTTSQAGTARNLAGVLGAPTTNTLYGSEWVDENLRPGFRFGLGFWFGPERKLGVEAGFMTTLSQTSNFSANSTDGTILARPYTDATTGLQQAVLVAFPGSSNGSVNISMQSGAFYSANVDLTETAYDYGWLRVTSLLGYRFYRYDESLRANQVILPAPGNLFPFPPGTQIINSDTFATRNVFHGIDMGFRSEFLWNNFTLEVLTKLAIGRVTRTFTTEGEQTITAPGVTPVTQPGGVLALASNSGTTTTADWKCMPEAGLALNWQIRNNISARIGYSFIFLNGVARAADQIDSTINPTLFPGNGGAATPGSRPAANHIRSDMWIQTLNLGVQFVY
jgi:hypothetical protein